MTNIRSLALVALATAPLALAPAVAAAQDAAGPGRYLSARQIAERLSKPVDGTVNFPVPTGPEATFLAARRDKAGDVEVHKANNDEFVVQSGHATVIVGGELTGAHETTPGEMRGGEIKGGTRYPMGPGDVLWIPAGQPHQVLPTAGETFIYFAAKFPARP